MKLKHLISILSLATLHFILFNGLDVLPSYANNSSGLIKGIVPIRQSQRVNNLCATASAEMVLRYYGRSDLDQYEIGESVCGMVEEYKRKYPDSDPKPCIWPNYPETYQPILAEYIRNLGFNIKNTRAKFNQSSGVVDQDRIAEFMSFVRQGIPTIVHVEGHYLLVVGYDDDNQKLFYNDPANGERMEVSYLEFFNRNNGWYKGRKGWDGRFLSVWK